MKSLNDMVFRDAAEMLGYLRMFEGMARALHGPHTEGPPWCGCYLTDGGNIVSFRGRPSRPHDRACPRSRFIELFAPPETKAIVHAEVEEFARWVKQTDENPSGMLYEHVVEARRIIKGT